MRLYFATDVHGSETCWRKFLNAAQHYKADVLVLGGDMTGKALVPIVDDGEGRWHATPLEVRGLQDGSIQGLYAQAPYIEGYTAMTGLVKYLRGAGSSKSPVSPGKPYYIQAPLKFITKADLSKPDTKKYLYRATC